MNNFAEKEARYIFQFFFSREIEDKILERYVDAHRIVFADQEKFDELAMKRIICCRLDLEALEIALRLFYKRLYLTKRIQIIFYLVESENKDMKFFFNTQRSIRGVFVRLGFALVRSFFKNLKGCFLIWRYNLV